MCYGPGMGLWSIWGIIVHVAILILIIWAVVTVVKSLTNCKTGTTKNDGGAK